MRLAMGAALAAMMAATAAAAEGGVGVVRGASGGGADVRSVSVEHGVVVRRGSADTAARRSDERGVRVWRAPPPRIDVSATLAGTAPVVAAAPAKTVVVVCGRRYYGLRTQGFYAGVPYGRPRFTQGFYSGGPDYRGDCRTTVAG